MCTFLILHLAYSVLYWFGESISHSLSIGVRRRALKRGHFERKRKIDLKWKRMHMLPRSDVFWALTHERLQKVRKDLMSLNKCVAECLKLSAWTSFPTIRPSQTYCWQTLKKTGTLIELGTVILNACHVNLWLVYTQMKPRERLGRGSVWSSFHYFCHLWPPGDLQTGRGGARDSSVQQVSHSCPNNRVWNWMHKLQRVQEIPNCLLYADRQRRCSAAPSGHNKHYASPMSLLPWTKRFHSFSSMKNVKPPK